MIPIKRMYDLQKIDKEIFSIEKTLAEIKAKLEDNAALTQAKTRLGQIDDRLGRREPLRKQLEFAVQQLDEKLKTIDSKLYGGAITNPRELSAYQDEKQSVQKQHNVEEEKLLELLVVIEELQSARNETRDFLTKLEAQLSSEHEKLLKSKDNLELEVTQFAENRKLLTPEIPPAALSVYESLLLTRGGQAVSKVEQSRMLCEGCRITVSSKDLIEARNAEHIVQCSSCRRILYVE